MAIATTENEATLSVSDEFSKTIKSQNIKIVLTEDYLPEEQDFRTSILRIKQKNPNAVMVCLLPNQLGLFLKQLRAIQPKVLVVGCATMESEHAAKVASGAMNGVFYGMSSTDEAFQRDYQKEYGHQPEMTAGTVYDIIHMIALAAAKVGHDPDALNKKFHSLKDFKGVLGTYSAAPASEFTVPGHLKIVEDYEFRRVR